MLMEESQIFFLWAWSGPSRIRGLEPLTRDLRFPKAFSPERLIGETGATTYLTAAGPGLVTPLSPYACPERTLTRMGTLRCKRRTTFEMRRPWDWSPARTASGNDTPVNTSPRLAGLIASRVAQCSRRQARRLSVELATRSMLRPKTPSHLQQ
jgi:hypothetical protein